MSLIDPKTAQAACERAYSEAVKLFDSGQNPIENLDPDLQKNFKDVFSSNTQSYREALLGCAVAKCCTPSVDVHQPYLKQGEYAFSGRTLDEKIINPYLQEQQIPCSKGAYLATFRRNVQFVEATGEGLRDKNGYNAMLAILAKVSSSDDEQCKQLLLCLMFGFVELRAKSDICMMRRPHLDTASAKSFLSSLLKVRSGGLIPVIIIEALYTAINQAYSFGWGIDVQGINDADNASGALGDITITKSANSKTGIEVTERPITEDRVRKTYNSKISLDIAAHEYVFIYTDTAPNKEAYGLAKLYHSQGCNISFISVIDMVLPALIIGGASFIDLFFDILSKLFDAKAPANIKAGWNDAIKKMLS